MGQAFTQWQHFDPTNSGVPGSGSDVFPFSKSGPEPWWRDAHDRARSAARTPDSEYPSGYLGTTRTRREDRLRSSGGNRRTKDSYKRGVHHGSRVEQSAYFWDDHLHMMAGLEAQAKGRKWAPTGGPVNTHLTNDGKNMPRGARSLAGDPGRTTVPARMHPGWKS